MKEKIKSSRAYYIYLKIKAEARAWRSILFEIFIIIMDHPIYSYILVYLCLAAVVPWIFPPEEYYPSGAELKAKCIWVYDRPEEGTYEIGSVKNKKDQIMTLLHYSGKLDKLIQLTEYKFHEMFPKENLSEYREMYEKPSYRRIPPKTLYHYNQGIHPLMYAQQLFILENIRDFVEHELRLLVMGASDNLCNKCLGENKMLLLNIYEFVQHRDGYMLKHGIRSVTITPHQKEFYEMMEYFRKLYASRWMWLPLGSGL